MKVHFVLCLIIFLANIQVLLPQERTIEVNNRYQPGVKDTRTYQLYLPPGYSPEKKYPLIIGLHGYGGSGTKFATKSGWDIKQETTDFIMVCPEGINHSWNLIVPVELTNYYSDDISFISDLIDTTCKNLNIDPLRIYVTGHSRGGFFSYRLGYELSDKIAAIAPTAAKLYFYDFNLDNPVPLIHFHSLNDSTVYYREFYFLDYYYFASVDSMMQLWTSKNNCNLIPDTIYNSNGIVGKKWEAISGNGDVELYIVPNAGHGYPTLQRAGISSVDVIWDFFIEHPKQKIITNSNINNTCDIKIYPNPAQNIIQVEYPGLTQKNVNYQIVDLSGKTVQGGKLTDNTIDVSHIIKGAYILKLDINVRELNQKFIIK